MNVLMITQTLDRQDEVLGFTHGLAAQLARHLDRLYVLQLWSGDHDLPPNVSVRSMGKERGASKLHQLAVLLRASRALTASGAVDLVFAHMAPVYAIGAAPFARRARVPLVLWYAHRQVSWQLRLAASLANRIVTPTAEGFRLQTDKLTLVGHGVDTDQFRSARQPSATGTFEVLSAGRIAAIKNLDVLLKAAQRAKAELPYAALRVTVLGSHGNDEEKRYLDGLKALAAELDLDSTVRFAAGVPYTQVADAFAACDLHVNLAPTGAPDKAVLQAMACERIPLASNRTFAPIFGADARRCLFEERDAADLSDRIVEWARTSPEQRFAVGRQMRERVVRDHSLAGLCERLVEEFRNLAAGVQHSVAG
jgi:glycosyltransferase involved in cell wall biosynthesis